MRGGTPEHSAKPFKGARLADTGKGVFWRRNGKASTQRQKCPWCPQGRGGWPVGLEPCEGKTIR